MQEPKFSLRKATANDQAIIKAMVQGERLNPMGLKWQNFTLAVAQNGDVIGCVQLKPHTGCQELASLVVVQGWRNRGVAKVLIEHVKENAGIPLYLMCDARLAPFYAKYGFEKLEERGEMPAYFRRIHLFTALLIKTRLVKGQLAIMSWT